MPYNNPIAHEIRISNNLQKIARKLTKLFDKHTGDDVDFILCVSSKSARENAKSDEVAIGNYVASIDRTSSAMLMMELILKWQLMHEIPPVSELKDANGNSLLEIMNNMSPTELDEMKDMQKDKNGTGTVQ